MALVLKDRVKVTSTTIGTGTFTLGSAVAGYQDFSVIGNGNTTYYAIVDNTNNTWEVGMGTYSSTGPTLSRDIILESSNGGSTVSFAAGEKSVFVTYPAERSVWTDGSLIQGNISGNAATATSADKWTTARTLSFTGDATGSGSVDGSANVATALTLANTAVTAGTYTNATVTFDSKGRATSASSGTAPVTSVGATAPIQSSGGATPTISITQASSTTNGYLSSTDWNTFNNKTSNTGTVTSVGMTTPTGLTVTGSPVTTSGTLALSMTAGYSIPTTASQTNWDSAYTQRLQWDGGSTNLVAATGRTSLGATTVGGNMFTLPNPNAIAFPRFNADNTVSALDAATFRTAIGAGTSSTTGTVTSVAMTVPTGLSVSGTPITTSGTLALTLTAGYSIPTTASQTNWDSAYTQRLQWDGGSTNLVAATGRTSLGGTTVGQNFFTLTNPAAITFPRINADNTVSTLDAATFRTAIGAGTGNGTVTSVGGTGSVNGITLSGTVTSSGNLTLGGTLSGVSLSTQVSGTLPIANGGTGLTSVGSNGTVLTSNGSSASWAAPSVAAATISYFTTSIATNTTFTSGQNGLSVGPVTISSGVSVTVPSGQRWVVL